VSCLIGPGARPTAGGHELNLDFFTLYVIILLNSLTLTIVWGAICYAYRTFEAARYWLASCILTTLGGCLLALEALPFGNAFIVAGNACIIFGFAVTWGGVRVFYGARPRWDVAIALTVVASLAMALFLDSRPGLNMATAGGQVAAVGLAALTLLRNGRRRLGALVAASAMGLALLGHGAEFATNGLRLAGLMTTEAYYAVAAVFLVAVIFGGGVWNLGFVLMAVDRLRSELAALAQEDDLTGLPNRRRFMQASERLEAIGRRTGQGFSLLLIDLDCFKEINDRYGHAAGDACLVHFAALASSRLRKGDMLARLSGDEFCVSLPGADLARAATVAGDLVNLVAANPCPWRGETIFLSISVGIAEWRPDMEAGPARIIEEADAALYATKKRGRNGFSVAAEALAVT